ncbi:MAG: UbiD family decarboxylase [Rickettsiales bacterium]
MSYNSLRDFIKILEQKKQLVRITETVDSNLELTEISRRIIAKRGPALLFENVVHQGKKSPIPVLTNLFSNIDRIALGLNSKASQLKEIGETLAFLRQPEPPASIKEALNLLPLAKKVLKMKPKNVSKAPCQEVVYQGDAVDLNLLPIQTCWPNEPAPLITWPLIVTKGPDQDNKLDDYNLGIYRMQQLGKNKTIMRWLKHRGGAAQHQRWQKSKPQSKFPAAAVLGCDPSIILAAVAPVPDNLSEYKFAGLLKNQPIELVKCKTIDLKVPAQAEIILEGHVSLNEYQDEGPYGDHTGYYNSVEKFPTFTISAITMRKKPIYLSTYTGKPPDEPSILGEAFNEIFNPLLKQQFPEITDFWLPPEGCSYRIALVAIKKTYPGQAKRIMMGIWSFLRQFLYTKFIIILDHDVDIRNWQEVMWAVSTKMDFARDTTIIENTPIDYLDFASPKSGLGSKMGFDATNKIGTETEREWGNEIAMNEDIITKIDQNWSKYGLD